MPRCVQTKAAKSGQLHRQVDKDRASPLDSDPGSLKRGRPLEEKPFVGQRLD